MKLCVFGICVQVGERTVEQKNTKTNEEGDNGR